MSRKVAIQLKFDSREQLLNWGGVQLSGESISILAGHYMLAYDFEKRALRPLIRGEMEVDGASEPLLALSRNFPEKSFSFGLDLLHSLPSTKKKILMLVDDVAAAFIQELPLECRLSDLRRQYFHSSLFPPKIYLNELEARNLNPGQVFESNFSRRASSILPTNTYLFSEHILRTRFRRRIRQTLAAIDGFRFEADPLTTSLIFERPGVLNSECVIEGRGEQACSGPALALMDLVRKRGYEHIVWFLPSGCREGVSQAVLVGVRELSWLKSALLVYEDFNPGSASVQLRESFFVGEVRQ